MKRRKFLHDFTLAAPALSLFPTAVTACHPEDAIYKNWDGTVLIVGAGIAGLAAGQFLLDKGLDVSILEASSQIGGRIRSLSGFADFDIELGAEDIHGNRSDWYRLIKSTNAKFVNTDTTDYFYYQGTLYEESKINQVPDLAKALTFVENARNNRNTNESVLQNLEKSNVPPGAYPIVQALLSNEYGASSFRLHIGGISEEDALWSAGDEDYAIAGRSFYSILQEKFAKAIEQTRLNTPVFEINYLSSASVELRSHGTLKHQGDRVIVTVPLPILQQREVLFNPPLPTEKLTALENMEMSSGMKIILKFNQQFWAADTGSIYSTGYVPEFWATNLGRGTTPVLTAFVMGTNADHLSRAGQNAVPIVLGELDQMFNGKASAHFVAAHIADWSKEPFIKGAYSYPIVQKGIAMREALAKNIENRLFFAGEATHTGGHNSTVHGALETGLRAAEEVLASIR